MNYYEVGMDDESFPDQWVLGNVLTDSGEHIDTSMMFLNGKKYHGEDPCAVKIVQPGRQLKFSLTAFLVPVVSAEVAQLIESVASGECDLYPVAVGTSSGYFILNLIHAADCVDEQRSEVMLLDPEQRRSEKPAYRSVINLTVDNTRTNGHHLFRLEGFTVKMIVSERIKEVLERVEDLGIIFTPVN